MEELALSFQRSKDVFAFEDLVNTIRPKILGRIVSIIDNKEEAPEVFNDIIFTVYRKIDTFNWESKFSSWLFSIVTNCSLIHLRKRSRRRESVADDIFWESLGGELVDPGVEDLIMQRQEFLLVLSRCRPKNQSILQGTFFEDKTLVALAEEMKISNSNAKILAMRAKEDFKKHYSRVAFP